MELKKNPEVDLEKKKGMFLQIGLLIAISLVFIAFEWKFYEDRPEGYGDRADEQIDQELPPITQQEFVPPPPPPPQAIDVEIVDDEEEVDDEITVIESEATQETVVQDIPIVVEDVVEEPEIFTIVEDPPTFPGGDAALFKWLGENIKYPPMAKDAGIAGTVFVTFVVGPDGKVRDVKVLRGVRGLDDEAIRVVKTMPAWKPGKQRGKAVSVQYNLPIRFVLK